MFSDREGYDDFWDFKSMLPPKKTSRAFSRDTEAVEIALEAHDSAENASSYPIPKRGNAQSPVRRHEPALDLSYKPKNALIKAISIYRWPSKYTFYERFFANAQKYHSVQGEECDYVPFFSYIPQYIQLTKEQLNYYLWWRENQRRGIKLKTDYSYILLYIYEIINIPDLIEPNDGIILLSKLYLDWRNDFPKLDKCMPDWICDYCCIYNLEPPLELLKNVIGVLQSEASFSEFYLPFVCNDEDKLSYAMLSLGCRYNWRQSKFYNDDTSSLFEKHIPKCFVYVAQKLSLTDECPKSDGNSLPVSKLSRDAFSGSLCAYNVKRRIDIEFYSLNHSPHLKDLITNIVKFSENQIRAIAHIKSRFTSINLDEKTKRAILEYFAPYLIEARRKTTPEAEPEYMKQYESVSTGFTPQRAAEIEERSWNITELLVDTFDDDRQEPESSLHDADTSSDSLQGDRSVEPSSLIDTAKVGLTHLYNNDIKSFDLWSKSLHMLPDSAVEFINEQFYDEIGDICIESSDSGYKLIDDYREDIKKIIL